MGLFNKKKQNQKKLDAAMLAINSILNEIYSNKSTDEYKMKGDITKSPHYKDIEIRLTDLKTLKGYNQADAKDLMTMFNTLHRPVFKTMVKEYIMEHNDKNTVYTSLFTVGYRLLVGELARIFASTEATDKGLVYKPDKISRKKDASKIIKLFNDELEKKVNAYVSTMREHPEEMPVSESYLEMVLGTMVQEEDESDTSADVDTENSADQDSVDSVSEGVKESVDKVKNRMAASIEPAGVKKYDGDDDDAGKKMLMKKRSLTGRTTDRHYIVTDPDEIAKLDEMRRNGEFMNFSEEDVPGDGLPDDETYEKVTQEALSLSAAADALGSTAGKILTVSGNIGIIATSIGIIAGLFGAINGIFKGFNPISDINFYFMDSYEKKIRRFENVSKMYDETKKAYEEYMRIPEAQRKKKVESKYIKNMEKYNVSMNNLAAQIEHFNQRAEKESAQMANEIEKKLPANETSSQPEGGDSGNTASNDDDFQF